MSKTLTYVIKKLPAGSGNAAWGVYEKITYDDGRSRIGACVDEADFLQEAEQICEALNSKVD